MKSTTEEKNNKNYNWKIKVEKTSSKFIKMIDIKILLQLHDEFPEIRHLFTP